MSVQPSRLSWLTIWLAAALLLVWIGALPVSRTQEARVLETARQMLGTGPQGWLVPHLNGALRLEKPPLCYWMSAAVFAIGGVSQAVGRTPSVLCGWLTLGLVFAVTRRLFDRRAAMLSCAVLVGSLLFFNHMRLAETDGPATLFVTLAICAIWFASQTPAPHAGWLHLAGLGIALAALAKGGPAGFPVVFLIGFAVMEKRWDLLRRFFTSGAALTALLLGAAWFVYVAATLGTKVFRYETSTALGGRDHFSWPTAYIADLLIAVAPWTGVMVLALIDAGRQWKSDPKLRMLLIWCGSILVPLCFIGNKQIHYLLPLMPPLAILIGRFLAAAGRHESDAAVALVPCPNELASAASLSPPSGLSQMRSLGGWLRLVLICMLIAAAAIAVAIPIAGAKLRGHVALIDCIAAGAVALAGIVSLLAFARRGTFAGYVAVAITVPLLMPLLAGKWSPTLANPDPRAVAAEIRRQFGDGPYVFYGPNQSLPLCFNLRAAIPSISDAAQLLEDNKSRPVVIAQTKNGVAPPRLGPQFLHRLHITAEDDQTYDLYTIQSRP